MHTAESKFSNFVIEYLSEIETKFENTLDCLSGAQIGLNHEKNGGRKTALHKRHKRHAIMTVVAL